MNESAFPRDGSAVASADFNGDGFTDVLVTGAASVFDDDAYLWKNTSNTNNWLRVRLHGTISNTWGIGASVTVISDYPPTDTPTEAQCLAAAMSLDARRQEVLGGSHNQNSIELEFGLGTRPLEVAQADCVIVSWPKSGLKRAYPRIGVNNLLEVAEDNPTTVVTSIAPSFGTTAGGTAATITGFLFKTGATVSFGGIAASVGSIHGSYPCPDTADPTPCFHFIDVTTPAHSAGAVDVTVANPSSTPGTLTAGYSYIAPGTTINLSVDKDPASNGVKLTWVDIGQGRYRVRRATGPTPADFSAGFQTIVTGTQYIDAGALGDAQSYY